MSNYLMKRMTAALQLPCALKVTALFAVVGAASIGNAATLIEHADVYPVSRAVMMDTAVLIDAGKIKAIGADALTQAGSATRVDATGLRLYPGLISANSSLGLIEIEAVRATVDTAEVGAVNPNALAQVAVHADSDLLPVARAGGVLTALSVPRGDLIAGQSALINLAGWNYEDMTVKPSVAMHIYWPSVRMPAWLPKPVIEQATKAAAENLRVLDATFGDAIAYRAKAKANQAGARDLRLEALQPVLNGELPLFIHANELTQIRGALAFAAKYKLKLTLVGALDGWRVADELKAANVQVILGSPFNAPMRRSESYDVQYSAAAKLNAAGVKIAIAGDGGGMDASLEKNLAYLAAQSAAFGLPADQALRAITLSAAEILGVSDRLGSIDVGKDANLILVRGDVLEITSPIRRIFIAGVDTPMTSRHTELCERYQGRYGIENGDVCSSK